MVPFEKDLLYIYIYIHWDMSKPCNSGKIITILVGALYELA